MGVGWYRVNDKQSVVCPMCVTRRRLDREIFGNQAVDMETFIVNLACLGARFCCI